MAAGGNASASHYSSTSAVHASSYDSVTYSTQHEEAAPVASQEPDPEENAAVIAATSDEEGLQSDGVTLEVAGDLYNIATVMFHTSNSIRGASKVVEHCHFVLRECLRSLVAALCCCVCRSACNISTHHVSTR